MIICRSQRCQRHAVPEIRSPSRHARPPHPEDRRLGAMLLQDGLSVFEIVDIAVVESQEQRTLRQRIAGKEIARVNELKARPNKIAELLVELLRRDRETIGPARMNLMIAQNPQRRTPEGEMSEAGGPPMRPIRDCRRDGHNSRHVCLWAHRCRFRMSAIPPLLCRFLVAGMRRLTTR